MLDLLLTITCSLKCFRSTQGNQGNQGNQGSTLVAPVPNGQILDDSGIGTSIRQLKQDGGLPSRLNPGSETNNQIQEKNSPNHDKDNETEKEKEKENVLNNIPVTVSDVSDEETNENTNPKTLHATISSQYESLLDTPPDSLLGHIPVTVLDKAAESFNSLRSNSSSGSGGSSSGDKTSESHAANKHVASDYENWYFYIILDNIAFFIQQLLFLGPAFSNQHLDLQNTKLNLDFWPLV